MVDVPGLEAPQWSRALGDDDDDLTRDTGEIPRVPPPKPVITWATSAPTTLPSQCRSLLCATTPLTAAFVQCHLPATATLLAIITLPDVFPVSALSTPTLASILGRPVVAIVSSDSAQQDDAALTALCYLPMSADRVYDVAELLFQSFQPDHVAVLTHSALTSFLTDDTTLHPPLLYKLATDYTANHIVAENVPTLPPPNIIAADVAAAIMTHCVVHRMRAAIYVTYHSHEYIKESLRACNAITTTEMWRHTITSSVISDWRVFVKFLEKVYRAALQSERLHRKVMDNTATIATSSFHGNSRSRSAPPRLLSAVVDSLIHHNTLFI